ncbi:hypothetical protein TR74_06200 [Carbonactinospora thermoautotrophica]|uniref:PPE domain-containing protein n=1 Tax=Carbonactinospora thermoautotrophica TaxID=1469144 RepID=A0A132MMD3_9ACTN|nr:PPE domain-containing protein [Carbonactinospora thermoautotrophica]KWW98879.1 hypothetical protein LI90_509 [Carbonactinospora thermoautotrophica]KWX10012.1 hypothetical protein TR74_06200 [Carbonactinospora thermoautotrophica]
MSREDHIRMWQEIHAGDPMRINSAGSGWNQLANDYAIVAARLREEIAKSAHVWQGQAAEEFRAELSKLEQRTRGFIEQASGFGEVMFALAKALGEAQSRMPEVPPERNIFQEGYAEAKEFVTGE